MHNRRQSRLHLCSRRDMGSYYARSCLNCLEAGTLGLEVRKLLCSLCALCEGLLSVSFPRT